MANFVDFKSSRQHTEVSLTKVDAHQILIAIYILHKLHRILFTDYVLKAEFVNFKLIQGHIMYTYLVQVS